MPTTLPPRSRESNFGRKRGLSRSAAALLLWAVTMLAVTAAGHVGNATEADAIEAVLQ
jgi:hypothetical protein